MTNKNRDLVGEKFGLLTVISRAGDKINSKGIKSGRLWNCSCECGNTTIVITSELNNNHVRSCGCLSRKLAAERLSTTLNLTHLDFSIIAASFKGTHSTWIAMNNRCYNKNNQAYPNYGGRGIGVCDRWNLAAGGSFKNFLEDMGERPIGTSIDRIDVDKDYCKENCRWANLKEQANNQRRNRKLTYKAVTKNLGEWAQEFNISKSLLRNRLKKMSIEEALTTPIRNYETTS